MKRNLSMRWLSAVRLLCACLTIAIVAQVEVQACRSAQARMALAQARAAQAANPWGPMPTGSLAELMAGVR